MYNPYDYPELNMIEGLYDPSVYKVVNTAAYMYWERALFQRATSSIIISNLPEAWRGEVKDFLYYVLFKAGYVGVFNHKEYGTAFQFGALKGLTFYYQPAEFMVTNPLLTESVTYKIGTDCELIKLTPDCKGIWDIISYYAAKLANLDNALNISIKNSKIPFILGAKNKAVAETIKKVMDSVEKGDSLAIFDKVVANNPSDKDTPFQTWERKHSAKEMYITDFQLRDMQTLLNAFDKEVGIPAMSYEKKERMNTGEVEMIAADASCRLKVWIECLNNSFEKVNKMFGLSLEATPAYQVKGGAEDGTTDSDTDRT